ncbi:MAG TPA: hemerythrin domain-containing protein [Burkholderiales bacterium]|nr:hemerythrin domain-containing protein [Burkholderiales bacterium]
MSSPVAGWHAEHMYFRQLLALLRKELEVFALGDQPNYDLMLDIITYLREYSDQFHHPREDTVFAMLAQRVPEMQLPVARLQQEHRVIAHAGEALEEFLRAILDGVVVPRSDVETAAATYLVYYGNHIAREEEDVLARAAEMLTPQDWEAVRHAAPSGRDPLFGDKPDERFRALRRQIAGEAG